MASVPGLPIRPMYHILEHIPFWPTSPEEPTFETKRERRLRSAQGPRRNLQPHCFPVYGRAYCTRKYARHVSTQYTNMVKCSLEFYERHSQQTTGSKRSMRQTNRHTSAVTSSDRYGMHNQVDLVEGVPRLASAIRLRCKLGAQHGPHVPL